jgi:hypothetical protein
MALERQEHAHPDRVGQGRHVVEDWRTYTIHPYIRMKG